LAGSSSSGLSAQHCLAVQLGRRAFIIVGQRHVGRLIGLDGERQADQLRLLRVQAGGFGVEGEQRCLAQLLQPGVETRLVEDGFVLRLDLGRCLTTGSASGGALGRSLAASRCTSATQLLNSISVYSASKASRSGSPQTRASTSTSSSTSHLMVASS
jgi:hypothetical protein